jgi:hypothetical protein
MRQHVTTAAILWTALALLAAGRVGEARAEGALADAAQQKAAIKCQSSIAKTTAKALATKLKAFTACSNAALACVQTKSDKPDCPAKAAASCTKKLAGAAAAAAKAKAKIVADKSCGALDLAALLSSEGLGFGAVAGACAGDFGIDVCDGLDALADCLLAGHEREAGELFGRAAPRAGELLSLLPGAPPAATDELPTVPGCGACSGDPGARKGIEKCGKALAGATEKVASALESAFGKCTGALFECVQGKAGAPECTAAATAACTKESAKVTKAFAKLGAATVKGCGGDFPTSSDDAGLNLAALAPRCADLGIPALDGAASLAACLEAESRCAVAALVRSALPRTAEFEAAAQLGGLTADLAATCPSESALLTARTPAGSRGIFGTIRKLVKSIRRVSTLVAGIRKNGGKPKSTPGATTGVSKVTSSPKVKYGELKKYTVTYHGPRHRLGGGPAHGEDPPNLVVSVARADIVFDDHFELPLLTLPGDGSDVDDEIEVEFADTIPACAFELSFATVAGDEVSEYRSILQVVDEEPLPAAPRELVSRAADGGLQNGGADGNNVAISANGRYVAFVSSAANLVSPNDGNGFDDVFVRDRCIEDGVTLDACTPATTLESINPGGEGFHDGAAGKVGISDDGRYVAYTAVQEISPGFFETLIYVKDRCLSNGEAVDSCIVANTEQTFESETFNDGGELTGFSADGRFVVFESNTVFGGDPFTQVYFVDRCVSSSQPVEPGCEPSYFRMSDSNGGGVATGANSFGTTSLGGRFVAYRSDAADILPPATDTNGTNDVFFVDRCVDPETGFVPGCTPGAERVNLTPAGLQSAGDDSATVPLTNLAVSDDGRYVLFASIASDLVPAGTDTNGKRDVFLYDRCESDGIPVDVCTPGAERINVGPGGTESNGDLAAGFALGMSGDGRFVVFASDATNLVGAAVGVPNPALQQVFQRDLCRSNGVAVDGCTPATTIVSTAGDGGLGTASSDRPAIAANGASTAFASTAPNLLGTGIDTNGVRDVFVRDR